MTAAATLELTDLSRQKRVSLTVGDTVTADHTVEHAIEQYRAELRIPDHGLRWMAFSRGRRLGNDIALRDIEDTDTRWTVMPEVAAGRP